MYIKTAYKEEPAFRESKVVYSIYDKAFNGTFRDSMAELAVTKDMTSADAGTFRTPVDFNSVMMKAIEFSDGVICNSADVDPVLPSYAKEKGIPVLEGSAEPSPEAVNEFYNKI